MNADVLTTTVADGIAVITMGSAKRIYFDEEMGDALTEALDGFAGDANVRVVVVTGGAPGYFIRHFSVAVAIFLTLTTSHEPPLASIFDFADSLNAWALTLSFRVSSPPPRILMPAPRPLASPAARSAASSTRAPSSKRLSASKLTGK